MTEGETAKVLMMDLSNLTEHQLDYLHHLKTLAQRERIRRYLFKKWGIENG